MRAAVIGHVEWVEFLGVDHVPRAGEIIHAQPKLAVPAGGGAVAAVQLRRMGAETVFFTSLGDDALGHRAADELRARGVDVRAVFRGEQRRAITFVDAQRERTIVVMGERLVPHAADALDWSLLEGCDAVYVTGCDAAAMQLARRAQVVTGTSRVLSLFQEARVQLDALVGSANDPAEHYAAGDLEPAPRIVVRTDGARGGELTVGAQTQRYAPVPTPVRGDTYGAGDTFAAALTFALGERRSPEQAVAFAAERAAEVLAFNGPYPQQ
jgi:ribokinase